MAILEDVPDSPPSLRQRRPLPASTDDAAADEISEPDIPLQTPSSARQSRGKKTLLDPPDAPPPILDRSGAGYGDEDEEVDDKAKSELWDEIFDSLMLTIPFSFLYLLLDILVHLQYMHRAKWSVLAEHLFTAVPVIGIIVFYSTVLRPEDLTSRHSAHFLTRSLLMSACIFSGARLIWLVNRASWSVVTAQGPPMGTIWIVSIIQLPLSRGLLALAAIAGYVKYTGLKIAP